MLLCSPVLFSIGSDSAPKCIEKLDANRKRAIGSEKTVKLEGTCNPSEQTDLLLERKEHDVNDNQPSE